MTEQPASSYKAVRNVIFNELGITRKEIHDLIVSEVHKQVAALLNNRDNVFIEKAVQRASLRYSDLGKIAEAAVKENIKQHVATALDGNIAITIAVPAKRKTRASHTAGK